MVERDHRGGPGGPESDALRDGPLSASRNAPETPAGLAARRARAAAWLASEGIGAAFFEDAEGSRDQALRYLSGQPGDALLILAADGRSVLVAWDLNLARLASSADEILAYSDFERLPLRALSEVLARLGLSEGSKIELPSTFAYPRYIDFVEGLPGYDLVCRAAGIDGFLGRMRSVKEPAELETYRRACAITDGIIDGLERGVRSLAIRSELDAALFIERSARDSGCEGLGFETLAAGPSRSWGIHAFPPYGPGPFAGEGMSILDFGVRLEGYTSDVTMSFVRGTLAPDAERMIELVQQAHDEAIEMLAPGRKCREIALRVDGIFAQAGLAMPHALGHGIGLDAHEAPALRSREDCADVLEAGQVVTIEPGLYYPELGGVRLEDDILITEMGRERLTASRIVRL
jgi:Xaa-Pro dipeptidase